MDLRKNYGFCPISTVISKIFVEFTQICIYWTESNYDFTPEITILRNDIKESVEKSLNEQQYKSLVPEFGGNPSKTVIVTTWRSGSTYLGSLLNSVPGSFYHFEPDSIKNILQHKPNESETVLFLKKLLTCNYTGVEMNAYVRILKYHYYYLLHNNRIWPTCQKLEDNCYTSKFLSKSCNLFPYQTMKLTDTKLHIAAKLLEFEDLNIKMIYLVRDPRGSLISRNKIDWCRATQSCIDAKIVCDNLVSDFKIAHKLKKKYPKRFYIIRYEDMCLNLKSRSLAIMEFSQIKRNLIVDKFIDINSKSDPDNSNDPYTTQRDPKLNAFKWMSKITLKDLKYYQNSCAEAIKLWGYRLVNNPKDLKTFNPLMKRSFNS
jgi:hypothetical protein